jgi:hypothetical protein
MAAYKRPQSLPFHSDFNNSAKITTNTFSIPLSKIKDQNPEKLKNTMKVEASFKP